MNCTNSVTVKTTNKFPIVIHPNKISTISGFVRKENGVKTVLTEATDRPQLNGLTICPRVVSLEGEGNTDRVPVRVCNLTCKPQLEYYPTQIYVLFQKSKFLTHGNLNQ